MKYQDALCLSLSFALFQITSGLTLPEKLDALLAGVDTDGDGELTLAESQASVNAIFDKNQDACLTESEFIQGWGAVNIDLDISKFTFDYVVNVTGGPSGSCSGFPSSMLARRLATYVNVLRSNLVDDFVRACEANPSWYISKAECRELPLTCQLSQYACTFACVDYIVNVAQNKMGASFNMIPLDSDFFLSPSLLEAYDKLMLSLDPNSDGNATDPEILAINDNLYDFDRDDCIEEIEFVGAWIFRKCGGNGLTEAAARQRWRDTVKLSGGATPECNGYKNDFTGTGLAFDMAVLVDENLQAILTMCEEDRKRYSSNRDCKELLFVCLYTKYNTSNLCKSYTSGVIKGVYGFAY